VTGDDYKELALAVVSLGATVSLLVHVPEDGFCWELVLIAERPFPVPVTPICLAEWRLRMAVACLPYASIRPFASRPFLGPRVATRAAVLDPACLLEGIALAKRLSCPLSALAVLAGEDP
jgi:hypothetical protein